MQIRILPAHSHNLTDIERIDGSPATTDYSWALKYGKIMIAFADFEPAAYLRQGAILHNREEYYIHALRVKPKFRRLGIGTALAEKFEQKAMGMGWEQIYGSADEQNEAGTHFLKRLGFTACGSIDIPDLNMTEIFYSKKLR